MFLLSGMRLREDLKVLEEGDETAWIQITRVASPAIGSSEVLLVATLLDPLVARDPLSTSLERHPT